MLHKSKSTQDFDLVHKDLSTKETKFWFNQKYNMHKKEKPSWSQAY